MAILALLPGAAGQPAAAADLAPVSCLVEPEELVKLSTPVAGIVAEVRVERGDVVRAGAVIARLDDTTETLELELARLKAADETAITSARAHLAFLEAQAERRGQLASASAVSRADAQEAETEAEIARSDLEQARLQHRLAELQARQAEAALKQRTLVSPVAGVVTERLLNPGEYRDGQTHIATIAKLDVLRVEAFVPLGYYSALSLGDRVTVIPEPPLDRPHVAVVTVIDRVFDAATATVGLRMEIDNADLSLPGGLRCQAVFDGGVEAGGAAPAPAAAGTP